MRRIWEDDSGQSLSEYSIILGIAAVIAIGAMALIGSKLAPIFNNIADSLSD